MPVTSLKYVCELYKESQYGNPSLFDEKKMPERVEREAYYFQVCEELSRKPAMLDAVITIMQDVTIEECIRDQAAYIGLLSERRDLWIQIENVPIRLRGQGLDWCYSRLPDERQQELLQMGLRGETPQPLLHLAYVNGYREGVIEYLLDASGEPDDNKVKFHHASLFGAFRPGEFNDYFLKRWRTLPDGYDPQWHTADKTEAASYLFDMGIEEAYDYSRYAMIHGWEYGGGGRTLGVYGSPGELPFFRKVIKERWDDDGLLESILVTLKILGSAQSMNLLYLLLDHPSPFIRAKAHVTLLYFFDAYDKCGQPLDGTVAAEGLALLGDNVPGDYYLPKDEAPPPAVFKRFWDKHQATANAEINGSIRHHLPRLGPAKPYDIIGRLKDPYETGTDRLGINNILLACGQYFAFDPEAFAAKKRKQYQIILDWAEANRERFPAGRWYRWGKDVTDEDLTGHPLLQ